MQKDLSALSEDDLLLFGVEDAVTRREMTIKFANSPNQLQHYNMYVFRLIFKFHHKLINFIEKLAN